MRLEELFHQQNAVIDHLNSEMNQQKEQIGKLLNKKGNQAAIDLKATEGKVMPTSCRELQLSGQTINGLYLVPSAGINKVETVACDFTLAPSSPGERR